MKTDPCPNGVDRQRHWNLPFHVELGEVGRRAPVRCRIRRRNAAALVRQAGMAERVQRVAEYGQRGEKARPVPYFHSQQKNRHDLNFQKQINQQVRYRYNPSYNIY